VIQAVAASGGTVVAVGSVDSGSAEGVNGMIWSRSGASWSRICPDACAGTGKQEILAVAATSTGGFVAVGRVTVEGPSGGHFDAAVWLSDDGENWRPAADDGDLSGDQNQVMKGVVEIEGRLIAAGRSGIRGAVWTSDDGGSDWTIVASPALQSAQAFMELEAVTTFGSRVIAVGHEANHAAAWFSDDRGSEWTRATVLNTRFLDQQMIDVVGVPSGLVAVGSDEAHAAVWESADGSEWTAVSSDAFAGASGMLGIALVRGGLLFAVGTGRGDSLDPSMNGRIWVSEAGG
jgi:hypothetical protein